MGLLNWFSKKEKADVEIMQFLNMNSDNRLRQILEWGDKIDDTKLKVFQHVIMNDSDSGVKMAALNEFICFETNKIFDCF